MNVSGTLDVATVAEPATDRERFLAALYTGPILPADAIVVFSGDGRVRLDAAVQALRQGAAHWCALSGGFDNPPHSLTAAEMRRYMVSQGLAPQRIIEDPFSQNTHEQAQWLANYAAMKDWKRALLVASSYHLPRAFLTVVSSLKAAGLDETLEVMPLAASQAPWWGKPEGLDITRADLFADELRKIEEYRCLYGHVASYADGLAYIRKWEGAKP